MANGKVREMCTVCKNIQVKDIDGAMAAYTGHLYWEKILSSRILPENI